MIAVEIGYKDATVSPNVTGTLYAADEAFVTLDSDTLANTYFAGRLDGDVNYKAQLSTQFWGGKSSVGIGSLTLRNDDGGIDAWLDYDFRDQAVVIKQYTGGSYNAATTLLNAVIERFETDGEKALRLVIRDPAAELYKPLTTAVFASESPEVTPDAIGTLKPIAFGGPKMCRPVLVNEATLEYHLNDTTLAKIDNVYDQGVVADYLPADKGFKLTAAPSGKVAATPITSGTGNDPSLTEAPTEYMLSVEGRSLSMFDDGLSPTVSHNYAIVGADHTRASSDGGKFYFEMVIDDNWIPSSSHTPLWKALSGSEEGSVAIGLCKGTISNPQNVKATDFAMFTLGEAHVGGGNVAMLRAYIENVEQYANNFGTTGLVDDVIGVRVDFDSSPMTIAFYRNDVLMDSAYGILAGSHFPVLGVSKSQGGSNGYINQATIRLIEDDFTYSIPANHLAWSEGITADTTFSKATESISDRVSVTFDSASVATIDALAHSSPEVVYTYGYHLDRPTTPAQILNWLMSSIGGYWFVNRSAEIQAGQLTAPGSAVGTISDWQIADDISVDTDYAPDLSNRMGANKNWSVHRESEVGGSATETFKQQISRDYQDEYQSTTVMADAYDHGSGNDMPDSLLLDSTAAQVEADRLAALYATERSFWTVPIALNSQDLDTVLDNIGQTYTVTSSRFGLSGGKDLVLVGVDASLLNNKLTLRLWG